MKKILYIFLTLLALVTTNSCRINNGDIGELYGTWVLTEMEVDGQKYDQWRLSDYPETFFQFQGDICMVIRTNELYDYLYQVCTWYWETEDTNIALNFTHSDDRYPSMPNGYMYGPPSWLLMSQPIVYGFDVVWDGDNRMTWTTVNQEGQRLTFHLKKNNR